MEGSKRQGTRVGLDYLRTGSGLSRNPEHFWPKNGIKVEVLQTEVAVDRFNDARAILPRTLHEEYQCD